VFFGGVSAPILSASSVLSDTITARVGNTVTVANNLQVDDNLTVTGDFYAGKVLSPLVQAFAFESDVLRPNANPGVTVEGDLFCTGTIAYNNLLSPFWVAGRMNGIGSVNLSSKGRHAFTINRLSQGFYKLSWAAPHPDGANFICFAQGEGTGSTWNILHDGNATEDLANSPTSVTFIVRNNTFALTDGIVNFAVLC
jgi:hypothetical protein